MVEDVHFFEYKSYLIVLHFLMADHSLKRKENSQLFLLLRIGLNLVSLKPH